MTNALPCTAEAGCRSGGLLGDRAAVRPCRQQVAGVDLLGLFLCEVGEAPVVRVGLEERVIVRAEPVSCASCAAAPR